MRLPTPLPEEVIILGWFDSKVNGSDAQAKEGPGSRVEAIYNFGKNGSHDHIVSNDGVNANYVRESGSVVVDSSNSTDAYSGDSSGGSAK